MMVIRNGQLTALGNARLASFEDKMVDHLKEVFPEWAAELGPGSLRDFVRHGMARASRHGFSIELDIARYLHVMHSLGARFDESPEHPWAPALLAAEIPAPEKMDRLRDAAEYHIEARRIRGAR